MPDWSEEIRDAANELDQLFRQRHTMKDVEHVLHRLLDRALKRPESKPECNHAWVSARNEVIQSGEICRWCFAVRTEGAAHER